MAISVETTPDTSFYPDLTAGQYYVDFLAHQPLRPVNEYEQCNQLDMLSRNIAKLCTAIASGTDKPAWTQTIDKLSRHVSNLASKDTTPTQLFGPRAAIAIVKARQSTTNLEQARTIITTQAIRFAVLSNYTIQTQRPAPPAGTAGIRAEMTTLSLLSRKISEQDTVDLTLAMPSLPHQHSGSVVRHNYGGLLIVGHQGDKHSAHKYKAVPRNKIPKVPEYNSDIAVLIDEEDLRPPQLPRGRVAISDVVHALKREQGGFNTKDDTELLNGLTLSLRQSVVHPTYHSSTIAPRLISH